MQGKGLGTLERINIFKRLIGQLQALPEFKLLQPIRNKPPVGSVEELSADVSGYENLSIWQRWWSSPDIKAAYAQKHKADIDSYLKYLSNESLEDQVWTLYKKLKSHESQSSWSRWWHGDLLREDRYQQYERVYVLRVMQLISKQLKQHTAETNSGTHVSNKNADPALNKINLSVPYLCNELMSRAKKYLMPASVWSLFSRAEPSTNKASAITNNNSTGSTFKQIIAQVYNLFVLVPTKAVESKQVKASNPLNARTTSSVSMPVDSQSKARAAQNAAPVATTSASKKVATAAINPIRLAALADYKLQKASLGSSKVFEFNADISIVKARIELLLRLLGIEDIAAPETKINTPGFDEVINTHWRSLFFLVHPDKRIANKKLLEAYGLDNETCEHLASELGGLKSSDIVEVYEKSHENAGANEAEIERNRVLREYLRSFDELSKKQAELARDSERSAVRFEEAVDRECAALNEQSAALDELSAALNRESAALISLTAKMNDCCESLKADKAVVDGLKVKCDALNEANGKLAQEAQEMQAALLGLIAATPGVVMPAGTALMFGKPNTTPCEAANNGDYTAIAVS